MVVEVEVMLLGEVVVEEEEEEVAEDGEMILMMVTVRLLVHLVTPLQKEKCLF